MNKGDALTIHFKAASTVLSEAPRAATFVRENETTMFVTVLDGRGIPMKRSIKKTMIERIETN